MTTRRPRGCHSRRTHNSASIETDSRNTITNVWRPACSMFAAIRNAGDSSPAQVHTPRSRRRQRYTANTIAEKANTANGYDTVVAQVVRCSDCAARAINGSDAARPGVKPAVK